MTYYFIATLVSAHISRLNFVSVFDVLETSWNVMAHAQKPDFVFGETDESI
jgi:hypothetical protein